MGNDPGSAGIDIALADADAMSGAAAGADPDGSVTYKVTVTNPKLVGRQANFSVVAVVDVKRSSGIGMHKPLFSEDFTVRSGEHSFRVPREDLQFFTYDGEHIALSLHTVVKVDDAVFVDTKVVEEQEVRIDGKPQLNTDAAEIVEPGDEFSFFANLMAIPVQSQIITLGLVVIGGVVALVNLLVGAHDQLSSDPGIWVYSHIDSDGDSQSPLANSAYISSALGAGVWLLMRRQLRKYMTLRLAELPARIERGVAYVAGDLISGKARVPLAYATLRIVAGNLECGQYKEQRGSRTVTVTFREPVRAVVLYEKTVDLIPAHTPISQYFPDKVSFDPMFAALYPPAMVTKNHGLAVHWEIQLIHPEFVDQELAGPEDRMAYADFLAA